MVVETTDSDERSVGASQFEETEGVEHCEEVVEGGKIVAVVIVVGVEVELG